MQQVGRDNRWTEKRGLFTIVEYTGMKARYDVVLYLQGGSHVVARFPWDFASNRALTDARVFCVKASRELKMRLENSRSV